jgi:dihydroorotate dehydrogenase electron transfer subunit
LIENVPLSGGSHLLRIEAPDARRDEPRARPGQFAMLRAQPSLHLLRRPMSIHDEGDGWRSYMVKPVGPASRELVSVQPGGLVDSSLPLGRGFPVATELATGARELLLVGGGFGIAPLHFLARQLDALTRPPAYALVYGGRTARDVELEVLEGARGPVLVSTDDGSQGFRGTCVDLVVERLREMGARARETVVLTCGSHAMMSALHAALRGRVARLYASLEEVMACGVGVCMGCVTPSVRGYVPICTEGPVFSGEDVFDLQVEVKHA